MNKLNENELVSLGEICDEKRVVTDPDTGTKHIKSAYFSSMPAMIHGAFQFVELFERMHREGRVYGCTRTDVFYFSLRTGSLVFQEQSLFIEEEKETFYNTEEDTIGMTEFLAPEIVESIMEAERAGEKKRSPALTFNVETDRYFMSVFLFEYFFHTGSPFEGKKMVNRCFLSPLEKEMFRVTRGQFCMDIGENDNTPVKGIQDKLIRYWDEYPEILRKMFQRAFLEKGTLCELRPTEVDWKQVLVRMAMDYKSCQCGFHGFSYKLVPKENGTYTCPKCGKVYYSLINGMDRILLADGEKLYECQTGKDPFNIDKVTAIVVENKQRKGLYGIKNISCGVWRGLYPNGSVKEIPSGQGIPIWNGMMVRFESGEEWYLRLISPKDESEVEKNEQ